MKILFISTRFPSTLTTGDRLRAHYLIQNMSRNGHIVDLLGFEDPQKCETAVEKLKGICRHAKAIPFEDIEFSNPSKIKQIREAFGGFVHHYPRSVWQFHSQRMKNEFTKMITSENYDVIHFSAIGTAELLSCIDQAQNRPKIVYDLIDAVSLSNRLALAFRRDLGWPLRFYESLALKKFEQKTAQQVDASVVVSGRDKEFLGVEKLQVIPLGLDLPEDSLATVEKDLDIVFVGNMSTITNIDAVNWFVEKIWPILKAQRPDMKFHIVGRDPAPRIQAIRDPGIVVTGQVDDVGDYLKRAKVFVAPLRFGAGQKTKILEAFSYQLAVVSTQEANFGIDAENGQQILLADEPIQIAAAILKLIDQPEYRKMIAAQGLEFFKKRYLRSVSIQKYDDLYEKVMS